MSRIRSIHPGFWTDETFAALSDAAALFYIGLLNEADDHGVFEWKPLTLRMRLRASKDGSVDGLLDELQSHGVVRRYEMHGRQLGAIRNFCRYQRPKFPKYAHTITPDIGNYVGSTAPPTGETPDGERPFPRNGETEPQREEEGGVKEEGEGSLRSPSAREAEFSRVEQACRHAAGMADFDAPALHDISPIWTLIAAGYDLESDILPKLRAARATGKKGRSWAYYVPAITEGKIANGSIQPKAKSPPAEPMDWVLQESPEWAVRAAAYRAQYGRDPPHTAGLGGMGWHFPAHRPAPADGSLNRKENGNGIDERI